MQQGHYQMLSGRLQAKVDLAPPQGPSFIPPHHFLFLCYPASHPFSHLALPLDIPWSAEETPKDLLRAEPGSSPFEVSGVLALHGGGSGGGGGVGRMGVCENLGGLLPGTRPKYPQSRGDDSSEACKAGRRRRRSGYHGEAAGSSHSSWALEQPRPAQSRQGRTLRKAHALTRQLQSAQAQLEALAPATNLTFPGTGREGFVADLGTCGQEAYS